MSEAVHLASGKVREIYALDDERLLLVASDRISTFDVILPTPIPDKGRVLTGMSAFWFARTREIVPNHLLELGDDGRSTVCRRLEMLPVELVVRGYLSGSGWVDYQATGSVCGHALPAGLRESDRLPEPIVTPATKAEEGHDLNITEAEAAALCGAEALRGRARRRACGSTPSRRRTPRRAGSSSPTRSSSSASIRDGVVTLGDEALTPDSSRFWPADAYAPGGPQPSFDKQFVRDFCLATGWDRTYPGPEVPDDVVAGTRARYIEAFERLTGDPVRPLSLRPEGGAVKATVLIRPKEGILDPQGEAVGEALRTLGFAVTGARVGRLVDVELDTDDPGEARAALDRMSRELLANPLIESFTIELGDDA